MTNVALTDQPERRTDAMGVGVGRRSRLDLIARMNVAGRTRGQDVDIWVFLAVRVAIHPRLLTSAATKTSPAMPVRMVCRRLCCASSVARDGSYGLIGPRRGLKRTERVVAPRLPPQAPPGSLTTAVYRARRRLRVADGAQLFPAASSAPRHPINKETAAPSDWDGRQTQCPRYVFGENRAGTDAGG